MLIELHLLTSHAPANLNRDDFGRPKTAYFGGTERARVSSQSQKRAIRKSSYLAERLTDHISTRSLHIPLDLYVDLRKHYRSSQEQMHLERLGPVCEAAANALGKAETVSEKVADAYGLDAEEQALKLKTSQIVFLTPNELQELRDAVAGVVESDEKLTKTMLKNLPKQLAETAGLNERPSDGVDMALFGRMTTDEANSFAAVDAAMQVAHPIATHTTITETDYFTAVDDVTQESGERGSGHIGELDFNSALFYKYFSCDFEKLVGNLGGDRTVAVNALVTVLDAACRVTPSGKQNSFASHSQADVVLLVVRGQNIPCSLANAFERPVRSTENGYLAESTQQLVERYCRLVHGYEFEDAAILFTLEDFEPRLPKEEMRDCFSGIEQSDRLSDLWTFLRGRANQQAGADAPVEV